MTQDTVEMPSHTKCANWGFIGNNSAPPSATTTISGIPPPTSSPEAVDPQSEGPEGSSALENPKTRDAARLSRGGMGRLKNGWVHRVLNLGGHSSDRKSDFLLLDGQPCFRDFHLHLS